MGKYEPRTIAKYFLFRMDMSQKKLHKMLFFAYAWYLYYHNESSDNIQIRLFEPHKKNEGFQAWVHGPVFRELYPIYACFGFRDITVRNFDMNIIDETDLPFFDEMFNVYGKYSADQLEYLSHQQKAWINARNGLDKDGVCKKVLNDVDIFEYLDRL